MEAKAQIQYLVLLQRQPAAAMGRMFQMAAQEGQAAARGVHHLPIMLVAREHQAKAMLAATHLMT
jgi:hypothetical protein